MGVEKVKEQTVEVMPPVTGWSYATTLAVHYALHPKSAFKTADFARMFGLEARTVRRVLDAAVRAKIVSIKGDTRGGRSGTGEGRQNVYVAGPALLRRIAS